MTFGKRSRTQSAQAGFGVNSEAVDFGVSSAMSSTCTSPIASTSDLPLDLAAGKTGRRPSAEGIYSQQQRAQPGTRSRNNSITSVTGSLRRVFTNASLATLNHKRVQSDAVKSLGGSVQSERQLAMGGLDTPLTESAPSVDQGTVRRSGSNTLRRSRTMLNYSKNWFRGSAAANVVERVNAQAVAPAPSFQVQRQTSFTSATSASSDMPQEAPKPFRASSTPVTRQTPVQPEGVRRASDTQLGTIAESHRYTGEVGTRRASKSFNPLKFLHNNRLSPLPSKEGA